MKHPRDNDPCFEWLDEFDCSEREQVEAWSALSDDEKTHITRLEAEIWGLLPCLEEPVEPSTECKEKLMRRLAPAVADFSARTRAVPAKPAAPGWLLPLAAVLAVLAIGFSLTMASTVRQQREQLASLESQIADLRQTSVREAAVRADYEAMREALGLVSSRGVEICPLRPMEASSGAVDDVPYGLLFLAADHQHWYVRVGGLEAEPGRYYRVWFETADGLVPAGNLVGEELELSSPTMPEGTLAVHVSRESVPEPSEPSEDIILFGNDMVQIL